MAVYEPGVVPPENALQEYGVGTAVGGIEGTGVGPFEGWGVGVAVGVDVGSSVGKELGMKGPQKSPW